MTRIPRMGRRMMSRGLLVLSIVVLNLASGCLSHQLESTARQTTNTLPDLQYQQVIDNLAMIASNPAYLPYLAVAGQGSVQVTDGGDSSIGLKMSPSAWSAGILGLGATRNVTGSWSLGTVTSPEKIRAMRVAYQRAVDRSMRGNPAYGWLHVGCKKDVADQAPYVGRHGSVFAWITPEGIAGLSDLTLTIMDIATREDTELETTASRESARATSGPPSVPRRNFQVPPSGPIYTPGTR